MSVNINLPSINGEIEAGITVGVDASLPEDKKLPIYCTANAPGTMSQIKEVAMVWAYRQFTDNDARRLLMNGIAGILDLGLIRHILEVPDGDWRKVMTYDRADEETKKSINAMVSLEEMIRAVTVAVATKANFWLMNHHTGQGAVAGYVKKVLEVFYKDRVTDQLVSAAHNLGHYTSTLGVLDIAGIDGVRRSIPFIYTEGAKLALSQDAKLRFSSMPAGTHRCGIAFEAAKRLVRSVYAQYCPGIQDMTTIPPIKERIMQHPVGYHIGASYLTGNPRVNYADTDMEQFLGRLGTFITTLYKNSTLAKSPHMAISRVESYEDYDADFKNTLIRVQQAQAMARGRLVEASMDLAPEASAELIARIRQAFAIEGPRQPAVRPN